MNQSCRVCGEVAAGYHFGAFTCEGCKSFFGRTYNNRSSIGECKNANQCVINKKNRTSCKSCRLKKCFSVGMSKHGSRYGRRSNWFKIHCLLQDQSLQIQQQQQQQQQQSPHLPPGSTQTNNGAANNGPQAPPQTALDQAALSHLTGRHQQLQNQSHEPEVEPETIAEEHLSQLSQQHQHHLQQQQLQLQQQLQHHLQQQLQQQQQQQQQHLQPAQQHAHPLLNGAAAAAALGADPQGALAALAANQIARAVALAAAQQRLGFQQQQTPAGSGPTGSSPSPIGQGSPNSSSTTTNQNNNSGSSSSNTPAASNPLANMMMNHVGVGNGNGNGNNPLNLNNAGASMLMWDAIYDWIVNRCMT